MKESAAIRRFFSGFKKTPFHPQWFVFKDEKSALEEIAQSAQGCVLDLGAGTQKIRGFLSPSCEYISLDYHETATQWYETIPSVFGDAAALPFPKDSMNTVLLLDVLEHLPDPEMCLKEVHRVLMTDGKLIFQVPFLYPLHDVPYDFQRWTLFGLHRLAQNHHFQIEIEKGLNHHLESAALLSNLALSKTLIRWASDRNLLLSLGIFFPFIILYNNLHAWVFARLSTEDPFMPTGYRMVWIKKE